MAESCVFDGLPDDGGVGLNDEFDLILTDIHLLDIDRFSNGEYLLGDQDHQSDTENRGRKSYRAYSEEFQPWR